MDQNVNAAVRFFAEQDAANEQLCYATAKENGHTPEEADQCDDFSVNCKDCPFR